MSQLSYNYERLRITPTLLLSFPRSGSNLLQKVVKASTDTRNLSIYGRDAATNDALTIKSHSPTSEHLVTEWMALASSNLPSRAVVLIRDPRDVMVSLLEYVEHNRGESVDLNSFFYGINYFAVSGNDRFDPLGHFSSGISVCDAFKSHVREWQIPGSDSNFTILRVRYENLVQFPSREYTRVLKFLGYPNKPDPKAWDRLVSQYSSTERTRGIAFGWCELEGRYKELIDMVNSNCMEEIKDLGYPP